MSERASFSISVEQVQFATSGNPDTPGDITVRGMASVYNKPSHDLGGFRTVISPGAFDGILAATPLPDVHLVWDHDTRFTLARTTNGTLELRDTPAGLHFWARMAPTSYAQDLKMLMERGDINQCSFACDIGTDEWTQKGEDVTRTITDVSALYDVTITAQGAFPQTSSTLVASFGDNSAALSAAFAAGRVLDADTGRPIEAQHLVEPETAGEQDVEPETAGGRSTALALARIRAEYLRRT